MELKKQQELLKKVVEKSWEDETFKQELIANPLSAIEKVTGVKINLPEGKKIVVQDQTDESMIYVNIPVKVNMEDMELNENELEAVAGGTWFGGWNFVNLFGSEIWHPEENHFV